MLVGENQWCNVEIHILLMKYPLYQISFSLRPTSTGVDRLGVFLGLEKRMRRMSCNEMRNAQRLERKRYIHTLGTRSSYTYLHLKF